MNEEEDGHKNAGQKSINNNVNDSFEAQVIAIAIKFTYSKLFNFLLNINMVPLYGPTKYDRCGWDCVRLCALMAFLR